MRRNAMIFCGLMMAGLLAGCSGARKPDAGDRQIQPTGPTMGYLEHRGRLYHLDWLMGPQAKAQSCDPFVLKFEPKSVYAESARMPEGLAGD